MLMEWGFPSKVTLKWSVTSKWLLLPPQCSLSVMFCLVSIRDGDYTKQELHLPNSILLMVEGCLFTHEFYSRVKQ